MPHPPPEDGTTLVAARPLTTARAPLTLVILVATAVAAWVPAPAPPLLAVVPALVLGTVLLAVIGERWRIAVLIPLAITVGLAWGGRTRPEPAGPRLVEVTGEVTGLSREPGFSQRFRLAGVAGAEVSSRLRVEAGPVPAVLPGDRVTVRGLWTRDDYGEGITAVEVARDRPREDGPQARLWQAVERLGPQRELAATLLLGRGSPPERRDFQRSGLAHLLAVSGLHLGIAAGLGWWILRRLRLPWIWRTVALGLLCLGYTWLTGASPPTVRAAAMVAVAICAGLSGREPQPLGILATAILILVVVDPACVHQIGFQLSATAVFGVITVGRELVSLRSRWLPLTPWPLDRLVWRGVLAVGRMVGDGLAIGIGASAILAPLVAATFDQGHPWSPVATVAAAPLVTLVIWIGLPWMACEAVWPGGPWAGLAGIIDSLLAGLARIAGAASDLPFAQTAPSRPSWIVLILVPLAFLPFAGWVRLVIGLVAVGAWFAA